MPTKEKKRVDSNLGKVIFHEHVMPEKSVPRDAKTTSRRYAPLLTILVLLHDEEDYQLLDVVVVEEVLDVRII